MDRSKNIEDSYKKKFAPGEVRNEGWNDPSDKIWGKIEKDIYRKDNSKFGFLPFLLMSLLAMSTITIFYLYYQNQKLQDALNAELIEQNATEHTVQKDKSAISSTTHNSSIANTQLATFPEAQEIKEVTNVESNKKVESIPLKKKWDDRVKGAATDQIKLESDQVSGFRQNYTLENRSNEQNKIQTVNNVVGEKISAALPGIEKPYFYKNIVAPRGIAGIKVGRLSTSTVNELDLSGLIPWIPPTIEKNESRAAYFSVLPTVAIGILQKRGTQETALTELIDDEYGDIGFGFDFLITQPISGAFDFVFGAGVESYNFATEYDITLPYNIDDETIQGNEGYIDFEHSLPTAFGHTDTALRLNRKRASAALDESDVLLDFDTRHSFTALSIPLGLRYNLGLGKSRFNIGVMFRPSYIISAHSGIQSVVSHHSDIDAVNNVSHSNYAEIRKFNTSIGLDVGYYLPISRHGGINLNLGYQDFIMDFYQVQQYATSVQRLSMSIGYFHSL